MLALVLKLAQFKQDYTKCVVTQPVYGAKV